MRDVKKRQEKRASTCAEKRKARYAIQDSEALRQRHAAQQTAGSAAAVQQAQQRRR